jgi:hypothetical protein
VGLGDDLGDPGVLAVDLVDHQHHRQPGGQRLAQHEPGLGQRAFARVDQQDHAVDHRQAAFHLAAEVGVAGGVDDVDGDRAVRRLAADRGVLRQDGDALFPLQLAGVHDPVDGFGTGGEGAGLAQHGVDERGLAVVDVSDDRDVSEVGPGDRRRPGIGGRHARVLLVHGVWRHWLRAKGWSRLVKDSPRGWRNWQRLA